jgi:DNA-directed RNA polymerase specialized sigma24 family protein
MRRPSNTEIFSQLYDEFMPKVFAYIHYRVNSQQTTEDLTSIVFEKALANFIKYSSDKGAFSTWIFTIARNSVIDHFRTVAKRQHADLDDGTIDVPSTEPSMTNRQISRMLHLSESNVGVRLFRAVRKLRADFEESWNG